MADESNRRSSASRTGQNRRAQRITHTKSKQASAQPASGPPLLLFNKPFDVLCQFTDENDRTTLARFLDAPGYYPAGRLDRDSEGLLLLTNDGAVQQRISDPGFKMIKRYLVQVDGEITDAALALLNNGIELKDGSARAIDAQRINCPDKLWPRTPPVRFRKHIPTSWIELGLDEGRNRQVRRMSAAVGFPTLRLIRTAIGTCSVWQLAPGTSKYADIDVLYCSEKRQ